MSTLYITTQGATLGKRGGQFLVRKNGKILQNIPQTHIQQIILCGSINITTPAITFCLDKKIEVVFLSQGGKFRGRLNGDGAKTVAVRRKQYERALDEEFCLQQAKAFVGGKLNNQIVIIKRQFRGTAKPRQLSSLYKIQQKISAVSSIESLRGLEGSSSAIYFRLLGKVIPSPFEFTRRIARPPKGEVNALLSLSYTLLYNRITSNLNMIGLDPYQGFFHRVRSGHAALASDLMEEFRPLVVDTLVLKLIRRKQLKPANFEKRQGRILLSQDAQKTFFKEFESQIKSKRKTDFRGHWKLSYSDIIKRQTYHFARVVNGEDDSYLPFLTR